MAAKKAPSTLPGDYVAVVPHAVALRDAIQMAEEALAGMVRETIQANRNGLTEIGKAFVVARRIEDIVKDFQKNWSSYFERFKKELMPEALDDSDQTNLSLRGGHQIVVTHKLYASIKAGMKEPAYEWLRANGLGDLIQETVNASTLSAAAKEEREEKNIDLPAELFNLMDEVSASVRNVKPT